MLSTTFTSYFHVVFTLPDEIADIALQNKRTVYGILFRATADTLLTIAGDPKHLGAQIGFFAVLHTWGQNLLHHPHLHCVVPGGGLSRDGTQWIGCRPGFFLPVRVLSRLFRRLFLTLLKHAFESGHLHFFGLLKRLRDPHEFHSYLAPVEQKGMGRLRQAAVCWTTTSTRLCRPLHPSRCHFQQPLTRYRTQSGEVSVERLPRQ